MLNFDTFRNCPNEYRTVPFWSWNDALDSDTLVSQIKSMRKQGIGGFFMHPRAGMDDEYLGDRFISAVKRCVAEAEDEGMQAWLYDEDTFPSGFAGGKVLAGNPDFASRFLYIVEGEADGESIDAQWRFVKCDDGWVGDGDVPGRVYTVCAARVGAIDRFARKPYPDLCNPDVTDSFIENTYALYAHEIGQHFGGSIPGVFTDEPNFKPRQEAGIATLPWTARMRQEFVRRKGYDLTTKLPELFFTTSNSRKTRYDYWDVISSLFVESFTKRIYEWCAEKQIAFTGHFWEHVWPSPLHTGSVMPNYEFMHVPGIDMLFNTRDERSQFGNDLIVKEVSSVAQQLGKERVLSETHGASGWNLPLAEQKRMIDWQLALGVNLICQHLIHVSLRGFRKRDFPLSFIHEPWWDVYRILGDYAARLCYILTRGEAVCDVLILHSATSSWAEFDPIQESQMLETVGDSLYILCRLLSSLNVFYDIGDEELMDRHGSVLDRMLLIGKKAYRTVVVPAMTNMRSETLELLKEFSAAGGTILSTGAEPTLLDGLFDEEVQRFFSERVVPVGSGKQAMSDALSDNHRIYLKNRDGKPVDGIYCHKRLTDDEEILFFCNTSRDETHIMSIAIDQPYAYEWWDPETGTRLPADVYADSGELRVDFTLYPCGSALLIGETRSTVEVLSGPLQTDTPSEVMRLDSWTAERTDYNALTLNRCRASLDNGPLSSEMNTLSADDEFKNALGMPQATIFAPQPWTFTSAERTDLHNLDVHYRFSIRELPESPIFFAAESPDMWKVAVNGNAVVPNGTFYKTREFMLYDITTAAKEGVNEIVLTTDSYGVLTSIESIYVVGNFAVGRTGAVCAEHGQFPMGDWAVSGYPYYSGSVVYSTTVDIDCTRESVLHVDGFMGDALQVSVNGQAAGIIGWKPYQVNLTKFLSDGPDVISIEVMNSMQNLMGPHHPLTQEGIVTPGSFYAVEDTVFTPSGFDGGAEILIY